MLVIGHNRNAINGKIVVSKFTEDLVGSVAHVLNYRQELRGWTQKQAPGSLSRVQVLAAQLCSEMKLQGKCPALVLRPWPCRVVPRHLHDCRLVLKF